MTALPLGSTRGPSTPSFTPRPYQIEARAAVRSTWASEGPPAEGGRSPLVIAATGTGKTLTALYIAQDVLLAGGRVVWLAHRRELLTQPLRDLHQHWPHVRGGIVQAGRDDADAQVVFASVDTLRNSKRLAGILAHGHPALLVVDEAHHSLSATHRKAIEALTGPDTLRLGLTATPDREDGGDLSELWEIAYTYGATEAIAGGWLVAPWAGVHKLAKLDDDALRQIESLDDEAMGAALLLAGIVEHTVAAMSVVHRAERLPYRDEAADLAAKGRSTMVFCASIEQAEKTCAALIEAGWEARFVHGGTPDRDRSRLLRLFREGRIEVLVNVTALTEGTDLPIASCAVLARPFQSWSLYVQTVGRVMRLHDPGFSERTSGAICNALHPAYQGKTDAFVLDLAGASARHSIVSAPVLLDSSRCADAPADAPATADGRPSGRHEYAPFGGKDSTKGRCKHCKHTIACLPGLLAGGEGGHEWADVTPTREDPVERRCEQCKRPQCGKAVNGRHVWVDLDSERLTICVECDAEMPYRGDRLASLVGKTGQVKAEGEWVRIPHVEPEAYVYDVDGQGLVLVVGERARTGAQPPRGPSGTWLPYWVRRGARTPRPLASAPVPHEEVRLRCADLLRRARRLPGQGRPPTERQLEYAEQLGVDIEALRNERGFDMAAVTREIVRAKGRERALTLGLAREIVKGGAP